MDVAFRAAFVTCYYYLFEEDSKTCNVHQPLCFIHGCWILVQLVGLCGENDRTGAIQAALPLSILIVVWYSVVDVGLRTRVGVADVLRNQGIISRARNARQRSCYPFMGYASFPLVCLLHQRSRHRHRGGLESD